jgi:hypothetical protein
MAVIQSGTDPMINEEIPEATFCSVAALDMERSAGLGKAEDQAAWTIFIIRVIFDNFTSLDRLSDFIHAYAAQDGLVGGV